MTRDRWIQCAAAVVLIASLTGAGWLMPAINASASDAQLKYTDEAAAGAPAAVVVAQSIGVVRGMIANYLWIRADKLKEDGKFFEAYHLSRWITQLQPRYASVWQFQAWNMAYNISVATHTRTERWQWVRDGIQLLRNHGIRYNPSEMMLYRELAWFFLHKIEGFTDDANKFYKQQLADEWQGILGEPPYGHEERLAWIQQIADAPERWDRVVEMQPAAADLSAALQAAGFDLDEFLLRTVETIRALTTSTLAKRTGLLERLDASESELTPEARELYAPVLALRPLLAEERYADAWPIVLAHARKRLLLDHYNMDPAYMAKFTRDFGPLDWRSPASHSLYWAAVGVERGLSRRDQHDFDRINTDRILFHSEQALKRAGRVYYDFLTKELTFGPDLRFVPFYENVYVLMSERLIKNQIIEDPVTFIDGYRNFLIDAVREYYMFGEYEKAQEVYDRLRTDPKFQQWDKPDRFTHALEEFILLETGDRWSSIHVATNDVIALLTTAFRRGLGRGDQKTYNANMRMARAIYDYFYREIGNPTTAVTPDDGRLSFEWDKMVLQAFQMAMTDGISTMEERLAIWERADNDFKLKTYDLIVSALDEALTRSGLPMELDEAFPPPAGLEAYRALKQQEAAQEPGAPPVPIERK